MTDSTDLAIVGAGPYGLSIAAHARELGLDYQVIGSPMSFWRAHMPRGMLLKSDGFASNLFDPDKRLTLKAFCEDHGIAYADIGIPVRLDTFVDYGLAFQKKLVPDLRDEILTSIDATPKGLRLQFANDRSLLARKVVLATGLSHFENIPVELASLPSDFVSHSSQHADPSVFAGREVAIIGAGSSASDLAILMQESGAQVHLVARADGVGFHSKMQLPRPLWDQIRHPMSGIGPGLRSRFYTDATLLFHHFPWKVRRRVLRRHLGPAGGWFMKGRFSGVHVLTGHSVRKADVIQDRAQLTVGDGNGNSQTLSVHHVIAATGYRVDLDRLPFLSAAIRSRLRTEEKAPKLSANFESSVPGLYFVGAASSASFGPVVRFAVGAKFTAGHISRHFGRGLRRKRIHRSADAFPT